MSYRERKVYQALREAFGANGKGMSEKGERMKYRKKPVVIEAFRLGYDSEPEWFKEDGMPYVGVEDDDGKLSHILIDTLEGTMSAKRGDYIIKGVQGEVYPCKPDIFEATYEAVDE